MIIPTTNYYNCVYCYYNRVENKVYIGSTKDLYERHIEHIKSTGTDHFHNKIRKHQDDFELFILCTCTDRESATITEDLYLQIFEQQRDKCYNTKFYNGHNYVFSDEFKQKNREAHLGENNGMYGRTHSAETRKRLSESMKGENNGMYKSIDIKTAILALSFYYSNMLFYGKYYQIAFKELFGFKPTPLKLAELEQQVSDYFASQ